MRRKLYYVQCGQSGKEKHPCCPSFQSIASTYTDIQIKKKKSLVWEERLVSRMRMGSRLEGIAQISVLIFY
jgi:hypothetical protein